MEEPRLVPLSVVDTRLEAETTMTMLRAYSIYSTASAWGHNQGIVVHVVDSDLEAAQALLKDMET